VRRETAKAIYNFGFYELPLALASGKVEIKKKALAKFQKIIFISYSFS